MTVALAGRAPATFEIKSATLPLVALLLKSADLSQLAEELKARFGDMPEFFDHDPLVIDLAPLKGQEVDFTELLHLLKAYRVMPVAVKGGNSQQMEAARVAGLAHAPDAAPTTTTRQAAPVPQAPPTTALVIDKPIRSGQQVYARGRDVVVMAMVNAGGEVISDGNIHVYAPLRGKAIAGARGDETARILTLSLEAELVSIAGIYRTSEIPLPDTLRGKPAQIRLRGDKLAIEGLIP